MDDALYVIKRTHKVVDLNAGYDDETWKQANELSIDYFQPTEHGFEPKTKCRLLYDETGIYGIFHVEDRYVRCVAKGLNGAVWRDSCVEFFVEPRGGRGYFNFEFNCAGNFLNFHIVNPERTADGFKDFSPITPEEADTVKVVGSVPELIEHESGEATEWTLSFYIPFAYISARTTLPPPVSGEEWRANFFKCGDATSHPHWGSWQPLPAPNFHQPQFFGRIKFE